MNSCSFSWRETNKKKVERAKAMFISCTQSPPIMEAAWITIFEQARTEFSNNDNAWFVRNRGAIGDRILFGFKERGIELTAAQVKRYTTILENGIAPSKEYLDKQQLRLNKRREASRNYYRDTKAKRAELQQSNRAMAAPLPTVVAAKPYYITLEGRMVVINGIEHVQTIVGNLLFNSVTHEFVGIFPPQPQQT